MQILFQYARFLALLGLLCTQFAAAQTIVPKRYSRPQAYLGIDVGGPALPYILRTSDLVWDNMRQSELYGHYQIKEGIELYGGGGYASMSQNKLTDSLNYSSEGLYGRFGLMVPAIKRDSVGMNKLSIGGGLIVSAFDDKGAYLRPDGTIRQAIPVRHNTITGIEVRATTHIHLVAKLYLDLSIRGATFHPNKIIPPNTFVPGVNGALRNAGSVDFKVGLSYQIY